MGFLFIGDATNPIQVDTHAGELNDKIVATAVWGGAVIAAALHQMDISNNHRYLNNTDNNDNSL